MDKQASPHSASVVIRNITIGVITSVLAATVIYFLGYNKDEKADFKKRKEATIKVWEAYQENTRLTSEMFDKMSRLTDDEILGRSGDAKHEMDVAIGNFDNIKKEPNADIRVYSTIDIRTQQFKEVQPILMKFYENAASYRATKPTKEELDAFMMNAVVQMKNDLYAIRQRDSVRLATYYEGLNKDYDIILPLNKKASEGQ
jgi:hypothetical protein